MTERCQNRPPVYRLPHTLIAFVAGGLLFLGCCASAPRGMRTSTTEQEADARVLLKEEHLTLRADGVRLHRVLQKTKAHTEHAVDELGDPRLVHDSRTQKLRVLKAETTMRDGQVVAIKPNSITETTPDALERAPAYSGLRETVVTHVGMEVGCTNELEYVVEQQASKAPFSAEIPVGLSFPIDRFVVQAAVPSQDELQWACLGCTTKPMLEAGKTQFVFTKVARINRAEAHKNARMVFGEPRLLLSTTPTWQTVLDWLKGGFEKAAVVGPKIEERMKMLTEDELTTAAKLRAIWRFVARDLTTVSWPLADFDHQPSQAEEVLARSYGHSLDKAVLLVSLLRAAKIEARPIWISRDMLFSNKVPALAQLTEVWVVAKVDGRELWLSPTSLGFGRALIEGRFALDLEQQEPHRIDAGADATTKNQSALVGKIALSPDGGLTGEFELRLTGTYNPFLEVTKKKGIDSVMKGLLSEIAPGFSTANCKDCFLRVLEIAPRSASFHFKAKGKAKGGGKVLEIDLPQTARSQLHPKSYVRAARQLPTKLKSRGTERAQLTITLPGTMELGTPWKPNKVQNGIGSLVIAGGQEKSKLTVDQTLTVQNRLVEPSDYQGLRDLAAAAVSQTSVLVVRKKGKE